MGTELAHWLENRPLREEETMSRRLALWGVLLLTSSAWPQELTTPSSAAFRVVTDVYFGAEKAPSQQTKTLFRSGVAYDISLAEPTHITMIDPARDRIVLLNATRQVKAEIDLQQLRQFIEAAEKQAQSAGLSTHLESASKVESGENEVRVGGGVLQYRSTLQSPREPHMALLYAQVADALAQLNGWRTGVPPFARITLNRAVAERQALPAEITRTITHDHKTTTVQCRLHTNWRLSKDDEAKIAEIGKMLATFRTVSAPEFFAPEVATASATTTESQTP